MKLLLIGLLLASSIAQAHPRDESFWQTDKQKHATASAILVTVAYSVARQARLKKREALAAAFFTTLAIGLAKEIVDDRFDGDDLIADAVGAGAGVLLMAPIVFIEF